MDIGMATVKLSTEADRLIDWLLKFKPEQKYITFPNRFGGHEIVKLLPRMAKTTEPFKESGTWTYRGFEIRFPPLADVHVKHRDLKVTKKVLYDDGKDIAILVSQNVSRS